jgi:hypothetical protein
MDYPSRTRSIINHNPAGKAGNFGITKRQLKDRMIAMIARGGSMSAIKDCETTAYK